MDEAKDVSKKLTRAAFKKKLSSSLESIKKIEPQIKRALIAGINLPHGCKSGNCGACKCRVLSGMVIHADDLLPNTLSSAEFADGYRLMCQAYANSDVIIDLPGFTNQLPSLLPFCHMKPGVRVQSSLRSIFSRARKPVVEASLKLSSTRSALLMVISLAS